VIVLFYRPLLFATFDPEVADVSGVNTSRMDALLMLLLSFAILSSMKVLGVTLICGGARDSTDGHANAHELLRANVDVVYHHRRAHGARRHVLELSPRYRVGTLRRPCEL